LRLPQNIVARPASLKPRCKDGREFAFPPAATQFFGSHSRISISGTGADIGENTPSAEWRPRLADRASMLDQVEVESIRHLTIWPDHRFQRVMSGIRRRVWGDESEAKTYSMHMGVYRHRREAKAEQENAGGCLQSDAG